MSRKNESILSVRCSYSDDTFSFRVAGATAELDDGRKIEVAPPVSGDGIIVIVTNPDKTWRTYFLSARQLASAVLRHEDTLGAKMVSNGASAATAKETT